MSYIIGILFLVVFLVIAGAVAYGDAIDGVKEGKAIEPAWRDKVRFTLYGIIITQAVLGIVIPIFKKLYGG